MKKVLSVFLGLSVAVSLTAGLTGCAKKTETEENVLTWYMFGEKKEDHDKVMEKANEIIEKEIGMKLDMQYIDTASYAEKMKLKMASSEPYDLAFTGYINDYQVAADMGGLYDITELIKKTGLDEVIPQYYLDSATIKGKIYGIPNIQVTSNPVVLEVLKGVAEECGIVETLAEIEALSGKDATMEDLQKVAGLFDEMFATVKEKRPDLITFNPNNNWFSTAIYETLIAGTGIRRDGTSTEIVAIHETEEWKLGAQKKNEWFENGYIRSDISSKGDALSGAEERKVVAFNHTTWKPGQEAFLEKNYGDTPIYAKNHAPYMGRTNAIATMISVGAHSENPEKAVEFIKLINTNKELYNLICWGIEGEHYTVNEEGLASEIPESGYNGIFSGAWKYGNQFNALIQEGQPKDVWEQTEKMNDESDKSPLLGFIPDTSKISAEIASIANVEATYKARRDFGTESMDNRTVILLQGK